MSSWEIHLFGPPRVEHDQKIISVSRRKTVALLAYLAVELRPHSRESLAALIWPEHSPAQAKANLRRDLSRLKKVLGDDILVVDRSQAALDTNAKWRLDVQIFQQNIQLIRRHNHFPEQFCAQCLRAAQEAVALYTDDFMVGFNLADSVEFDEWQFFTRESLRQSLFELLQRLLGWHTRQQEYEQAIEYGRRRLAMDTLDESAHRELMRLYAWAGQQAAAIRQYEECVRLLDEELGVPPEPETTELHEAIFARQLSPPVVEEAAPVVREGILQPAQLSRAERYQLGELLAEGGHGEVYIAQDQVGGSKVVIKRIKPDLITAESELLSRFQQEGEILARLNHPNIVRMLDTFRREGQYHIVMEYVPGGSLRSLLKRKGRLEAKEAVAIGLELADALGRAHHLGIIHRDLKPENVLMAEDGTPRLTDFGIAHLKRTDSRITRTGTILGSPNYISPEIIQEGEMDGRSDIWSLGVLLYEMLAGKTPFESGQIVTVLYNIVNEPEQSLLDFYPDLPFSLVNLIHTMLRKEPDKRPASMRQIAAVLEAIREGRDPAPATVYTTPVPEVRADRSRKALTAVETTTPHTLPQQATSFIGREEELAHIHRLLVEEASCRLLTLVGQDGIGKTRLAVEAAARLLNAFPDGVYFISLVPIGSADLIIPTIAQNLNLQFSGPADPGHQLIHFLRPKKMLLVVDQLEQLVEGGQILSQLLRQAPDIAFLVTVGKRLQLTDEWSYELTGLSLPEKRSNITQAALESESATHLFLQRARRARADFELQPHEIPQLIEICGLLDCLPLAIELTAPWVRALSLTEIAGRIRESFAGLPTSLANNRSDYPAVRAVFSQTWADLTAVEEEALSRLAVFQGGCSREAAAEVTGASVQTLNGLVDKALIRQTGSGRYELHNLIRQMAGEKLQSDPEESELIYDIHCRYYLSYLEQQTPSLKSGRERQVLAAMTADAANFRAAWEWAVEYLLLEDLTAAAQGYWLFHQFRGLLYEGEATFRHTAEKLINAADYEIDSQVIEQLAGFFKAGQGDLMVRRGLLAEGINEIENGLELMRQDEDYDPVMASFALSALAAAQLEQGHYAAARETAQESLELIPRRGDPWARAICLQLLAEAAQNQGQPDVAEELFRACLDICAQLGETRLQTKAKIGLSRLTRFRGKYGRAQQWLDESLELVRTTQLPWDRTELLREQGILALERGQLDQAVIYLEKCKAVFEAGGRNDGGLTDIYLGRCHHERGKLSEADDYYRQGLAAARTAGYEPGAALAFYQMGLLALAKERPNQAEQHLQDALVIWQEMENEAMMAQAYQSLGDVTVQAGESRVADSRAYYRQSLRLAVKHELAPVGLKAILGLVPLLVRSGEIHLSLRLLILTEQHPAGSYQVKRVTQEYLAGFAEDEVTAVRRETISFDWLETAEELVNELATASWGQKPVYHNLPVHRSAFFGRHNELAEIQKHLLDTKCRLISIIGPGGIGKTRLGIAAGSVLASHFPQGVFLIPLAPLESADQIYITLAEILGVQNLVVDNPKPQLLHYLKHKQMLLIFDNYEHLLPQVDFIADIIDTAPNIQMIVTTRERLNLGLELVFTLKGMSYPTAAKIDPKKLAAYDAVQLLVDHALLARPDVDLQPEDYKHIVRICHLVQGMPLALVLAANWLDMLSFAEIADEISDSLDFLESERGDLPPRQRSVRAVFNGSWSRLPPAAQETFARLTVFRGGFSREAARAVCKTSLRDLRILVNSSFVTVSATGRYEVHELMRQLGAEQLENMGTAESTKDDHSRFYLAYLQELEVEIRGPAQLEVIEKINEDYDNIRSAWNWAAERGDRTGIDQAQECLHLFFDYQARYAEGRTFFLKAKTGLQPPPGGRSDLVYGKILNRYAFLGVFIVRSRDVLKSDLDAGLEIVQAHNDQFEIALNYMARSSYFEDPPADLKRLELVQEMFAGLNDDFYLARALVSTATCYGVMMDTPNSKKALEKCIPLVRSLHNGLDLALALGNLAEIELIMGQYDLAQQYIQESLTYGKRGHSFCTILSGYNQILAGNVETAEQAGRTGLASAEEIGHRYLTAIALALLSICAGLTGEYEDGRKMAEQSCRIEENNMLGLVMAPLGLFINNAQLGRWQEACQALSAAFKQAEDQKLPAPLVWLMAAAALVAEEKGQFETAVRYLSISKNHSFAVTGWMSRWPRLANLEFQLKQHLNEKSHQAAWKAGMAFKEEMLPPQLLAEVYQLLTSE